MKKKNYIQPTMKIEELSSQDSLMQMVLGSSTGPEPGKSNAPQRRLVEMAY